METQMSKGIVRAEIDTAGGVIQRSQSKVFINGYPISVLNDAIAPHNSGIHLSSKMIQASSKIYIKGIPVCLEGDAALCGHTATGSDKVRYG